MNHINLRTEPLDKFYHKIHIHDLNNIIEECSKYKSLAGSLEYKNCDLVFEILKLKLRVKELEKK